MANNVEKLNGIAITSIEKVNGITDDDLEALNGEEFTGTPPDSLVLISTHTASASSTIDITSGLDSTYDIYEFHFINIHPSGTGLPYLGFQVNADGGSGFNEAIQSSYIAAQHTEDNSASGITYNTYEDQDVTDGEYQELFHGMDDDADESVNGILKLYAPSSGTYVKHYVSRFNGPHHNVSAGYQMETFGGGYISTSTAIDEISFKMSAGNIDAGTIKMYGIIK
jgi:hypothetical protein